MTKLSPLEEVLFKSWARAHGVDNHDDPNNQFDHRGLYKQTNGLIMPGHVVRSMADMHNKAMEPQDSGNMEFPDPYAAQAEMHGNMLKAQGDQAKLKAQSELEDKKHQQKLQLEQMKLQHTSAEKDKERQHKAQESQQSRAQAQQDAERQRQQDAQAQEQQRQYQLQDSQVARQQQVEDSHRDRQNQVQDSQMGQEHELKSTLVQEQLARSRPQPQPKPGAIGAGQSPTQGQGGPPGGQPPQAPTQPQPSSQSGGLQDQLMQRAMGGGR